MVWSSDPGTVEWSSDPGTVEWSSGPGLEMRAGQMMTPGLAHLRSEQGSVSLCHLAVRAERSEAIGRVLGKTTYQPGTVSRLEASSFDGRVMGLLGSTMAPQSSTHLDSSNTSENIAIFSVTLTDSMFSVSISLATS